MRIFHDRKAAYTGIAKKGMEAMELQTDGYSVAEIAKMYDTTPNNINAWISRARKKLKQDVDMMSALR
jgi:DNA-directed RNA polymerase specialized sigma24 family protein